jgi:hypothetical protein
VTLNNRFLLLCCRRVQLLPEGGDPAPLHGTSLGRQLATTLVSARRTGQVRLSHPSREHWHNAYQRLAEPQGGVAGAISARAEAHTIRLALLYTLLDNAREIQPAHLDAALALWNSRNAQPPGRSSAPPATRSPDRSTQRSLTRSPTG